jgi:hypothetical protein
MKASSNLTTRRLTRPTDNLESCYHEFGKRLSPADKDLSTEAERYLLLKAVTRQRLIKTQKNVFMLQYSV